MKSFSDVRVAYDEFASTYDKFSAAWNYERWLDRILEAAYDQDAHGRRILDIACGTGTTLELFKARGYHAMGCDISPRMIDIARSRLSRQAIEVFVADMRLLPEFGEFDVVTCLHDPLNYLLEGEELSAAFASVAANLKLNGLFIFDVNTLFTYKKVFGNDLVLDVEDISFRWKPTKSNSNKREGSLFSVVACVFANGSCDGDKVTNQLPLSSFTLTQRHWPIEVITEKLLLTGFEHVAVLAPERGVRLGRYVDDLRRAKTIFIARLGQHINNKRRN